MKEAIRINQADNVAVALCSMDAGSVIHVDGQEVLLRDSISAGHKFSIASISNGSDIIKYGMPIGRLMCDVKPGTWIHTHNIRTKLDEAVSYSYEPELCSTRNKVTDYFDGYVREDGSVGIRNDVWIIPTVGCVNSVAKALADRSDSERSAPDCNARNCVPDYGACPDSQVNVTAFAHPYGCSQMGEDQEYTRKILAGLIRHPNAGGVLVLGLGCENSNIEVIRTYLGDYDSRRVQFLECQAVEDELEQGSMLIKELIEYASSFTREKVSMDRLVTGLKCGGSDGFSGITANPLVGRVADRLVSRGGTVILTEVPEMFGAETLLMKRCIYEETFCKTVKLIENFKDYYKRNNQTIYENPSPGNKKGGISTLEDKALGCTQKSGTSPVTDVLDYGCKVRTSGLNLLSAPGNDLVAATALAASGAQLILFTTGRGTPFASPVPTVKISTNSALASRKPGWIDYNAGTVIEDSDFVTEEDKLYEYIKETASGKPVKAEINGYHDMALFKLGVTL